MSKALSPKNQSQISPPGAGLAQCQLPSPGPAFTVGHVLKMHCKWEPDFSLKPPVSIEPLKEAPFRLVILKTLSLKPGEGVFEVTGYQPGRYKAPLTLRGGEGAGGSLSASLEWNIDSVLKPGLIKPHPPYGPWVVKAPYPLWGGVGLCFFLMLVWGVRRGIKKHKRKKWLHTLADRCRGKDALFIFTRQLHRLTRQLPTLSPREVIQQLQICFTDFLENEGANSLKDLSFKKLLRQVKKFEGISPLQKKQTGAFLTELEKSFLVSKHLDREDLNRLLIMGREVAIGLHSPSPPSRVRGGGGV